MIDAVIVLVVVIAVLVVVRVPAINPPEPDREMHPAGCPCGEPFCEASEARR